MSPAGRAALKLFLLSLGLRALALTVVLAAEVAPLYDEAGYLARAAGAREVLAAWGRFDPAPAEALAALYGGGEWPPLHPTILALGQLAAGSPLAGARATGVVVSALSTLLVFRLALLVAGERAARRAALVHALFPSFVAFSHLLWAETSFIAFLLAGTIAAVECARAGSRCRGLLWAAGAGLLLGLGTLTRVTGIFALLAAPLWLAGGDRRKRAAALLLAVVGLGAILPWQATLVAREGRWAPLSTLAGWNLALGNNPWVPGGYGSSWGHEPSKRLLRTAIERRQADTEGPWSAAAGELARDEIRRRPARALGRSLERLRMLVAPDHFTLRHLFRGVYPPVAPWLAGSLALGVIVCHLALLAAIVRGAAFGRAQADEAGLPLWMGAALMLPAAATIGMSRLLLPILALALPAASIGLGGGSGPARGRGRWVAAALACALSASTVPLLVAHVEPSTWYASVVRPAAWVLGAPAPGVDRFELRRTSPPAGPLEVAVRGEGAFRDGRTRLRWPATSERLTVDVVATGRSAIELAVRAEDSAPVVVRPVRAEAWRARQPIGELGVELVWLGGAPPAARTAPP